MRSLIFGLLAGALILMLCVSGCTTTTQPPVTEQPTAQPTLQPQTTKAQVTGPQGLIGVTWYLIAFNQGGSSLSIKPGTNITAFFDTQGTVSGFAGC
ncbi:MAG: META domain-containing protein, partial [Methanoregulaceae archaeon]|nr:META domain-containing protein [Methanoregulaceae archaeon]